MATYNGRQPSAKIQGTQGPKDAQSYLKQLEELLKRNTGSGTFIGSDTSSNSPMYLPGKVANPTGLSQTPSTLLAGNGMSQMGEAVQRDTPQEYQDPVQPPEEPPVEGPPTVEDFFTQIAQQQTQPQSMSVDDLEQNFVSYGIDYGVASLPNNQVQMRSGAIKDGMAEPVPVASMEDGTVGWSDGYSRNANQFAMDYLRGVKGLSQALFGQQQTVTQPYGNVNPIEPTPGNINYGTDFRTRDLQRPLSNIMGIPLKVIQILRDDGTQFGSTSGHQGYGNSVLVQLPSGETLRLSHLSSMGNFQEGDTINPGELIGVPGATGNTTGEHLDVEYRNAEGQMQSPAQFRLDTSNTNSSQPGEVVGYDPNMNTSLLQERTQQNQSVQPQPQQVQPAPMQPSPQLQAVRNVADRAGQITNSAANTTANAINTANPTGSNGIGFSEFLQGNREGARAEQAGTLSNIGTTLNAPDLNTKALSSEQGTNPVRQLAGNLVDYASTPLKKRGLPDLGISEFAAGGKTLNTDVNLAPQAGASDGLPVSRQKAPQDYSSVLGQNIKDVGNSLTQGVFGKAGEGVKALSQAGTSTLESVFKPKQDTAKRAVGDVSGTSDPTGGQFSSLMDSAPSMASFAKNDVADPFFKMGGSEMYKDYLKPNARDIAGGALTLDLFTPDFYKDLGNVSSVFGGSKDLGAATDRYIEYEKQKYQPMSKMDYQDGYDRGEIENYNRQVDQYNSELNNYFNSIRSSVAGSQSIFTPLPASSSKNLFSSAPSASQMASMPMQSRPGTPSFSAKFSSSAPQVSRSTPQMSSPQRSAPSMSSTPANANTSTNRGAVYSAPPKQSAPAKAAPKVNFTPSNANTSTNKGPVYSAPPKQSAPAKQSSQQSKPSSNVFSKVSSAIKKVFGR